MLEIFTPLFHALPIVLEWQNLPALCLRAVLRLDLPRAVSGPAVTALQLAPFEDHEQHRIDQQLEREADAEREPSSGPIAGAGDGRESSRA